MSTAHNDGPVKAAFQKVKRAHPTLRLHFSSVRCSLTKVLKGSAARCETLRTEMQMRSYRVGIVKHVMAMMTNVVLASRNRQEIVHEMRTNPNDPSLPAFRDWQSMYGRAFSYLTKEVTGNGDEASIWHFYPAGQDLPCILDLEVDQGDENAVVITTLREYLRDKEVFSWTER